ncbi:hypothetical protein MMC30_005321 [Trapelia coarctata]|nr:hypothetical protein [Trapelia coarctata]
MDHQKYVELYGGIIAEAPSASEADMVPTQSHAKKPAKRTRRKSPKSPESEEAGQKGKRGRPRVDTQDESAVERRRTQIRLAQRAYRERKETTISALEKRVAELQQTISEMNRTFTEYNDKAMASGIINLDPTLGQQLKVTTKRFLGLAQVANQESDVEGTAPTTSHPRQEPSCADERTITSNAPGRRGTRSTSTQDSTSLNPIHPASMLGYEVTYENTGPTDESRMDTGGQASQEDFREYSTRSSSWDDRRMDLQQYRAQVPEVPIMTPFWNVSADTLLKPTSTYSFQESTFGRRLLRLSYEKAFRCLSMANPSQDELQCLRYTLCYGPPKAIRDKIGGLLKRSTKESLENWDFPLLHIGNSGLHYPRSSLDSDDPLPDYWSQQQSVGPYPPKNPWVPVAEADYPRNLVQFANIEGIWFDANDVEQYLKSKGLFIDGRASIAEIVVEEPVPGLTGDLITGSPTSLSNESTADPQSPPQGDILSVPDLFAQNTTYMPETSNPGGVPYLQSSLYDFMNAGDISTAWMDSGPAKTQMDLNMSQPTMLPEFNFFDFAPRKRKLAIDVDRLLDALNEKAVCLGRAPGYRQDDVDAALNKVMQEAY